MPLSQALCPYFTAGSHLHLTGETMEPSFFISAKALSTILRSSPVNSATFPAFKGSPAFLMASKICSFSFMSATPLITEHFDHVVFHANLLDKAEVTFDPVVVILFINYEFLNHVSGNIVIVKQGK